MTGSAPEHQNQPDPQQPHPQQPHPQQHQYPPQHHHQSPPKKKRGCMWAAIIGLSAFMLLTFVGCVALVASSGSDGLSSDSASSSGDDAKGGGEKDGGDAKEEEKEEAKAAGIGDTVKDGAFAFTVTDVETGVASVGSEFLSEDAQGQFVIVHITVENIGDEARYFDGSNQKLYDAEGKEYSNDTGAEIYMGESESFLNEINPGNKVDAKVVYDIPEGVTPDHIKLNGSLFGGSGVTVKL